MTRSGVIKFGGSFTSTIVSIFLNWIFAFRDDSAFEDSDLLLASFWTKLTYGISFFDWNDSWANRSFLPVWMFEFERGDFLGLTELRGD